ncbi:IS66-like element accessory protein TnpA [Jiella avicenniae]|uniref:Transposase n=1 Tax=Jiella avicenniae TaxID=2907202 RepID=A0A9X1P6S3_9HYPH|nr:transposase [Jiella avicenniae]MCE7030844.1 transposase [Jiella avicenniae]
MDRNTHRAFERLEIVETGRRRRWSDEEKLKIVIESMAGPRLVSATARRYGISRSQLAMWRRTFRNQPAGSDPGPTFVPAVLAPVSEVPRQESVATSSRMEIILTCGRRIVIDTDVDPEALARVIAVVDRQKWLGLSEQPRRLDKWIVCRVYAAARSGWLK